MPSLSKLVRRVTDNVALWLLVIGGANWGLVNFFNNNLVTIVANNTTPIIGTIIYGLVGLSALWVGGLAIAGKFLK
jgi:uncharacterized protein